MKSHLTYQTRKHHLFDTINVMLLTFVALLTLFPFYNVLILAFSDQAEFLRRPSYFLPYSLSMESFQLIFKEPTFVNAFGLTVFITIAGVILSLCVTCMGAYALSKKELPGRGFLTGAILVTMFFQGGMIPYYLTLKGYGLVNNVLVLLLPMTINTFNLIVMKSSFQSIPASLEESARIDGANDFCILVRIVIPISLPIVATFALFYAVAYWNDWWNALIFISSTSKKPLQIFLRELLVTSSNQLNAAAQTASQNNTRVYMQGMQMASIVISVLPIALVYPWLQKYFVKGVMVGSIKE